MFLDIAKKIWGNIRDMFFMKKNVSRVLDVYEDLFTFRQGDKSLEDYYNNFKGMIDKSNQHHPLTNDIEVLKNSVKNYMQVSFRSQLSTQTTSRIATSRRREHFLSAKYILMC